MAGPGKFGVWALPTAVGNDAGSPGIDEHGRPVRKRRKHVKSRKGCVNCKERRVKCDEQRPICVNCSRLNLLCRYDADPQVDWCQLPRDPRDEPLQLSLHNESTSLSVEEYYSASHEDLESISHDLKVPYTNLQSLILIRQFENYTARTLLFGCELWQQQILPLASQHEYLMHAVLLITASHLRHLNPDSDEYPRAIVSHLAQTLAGFRVALRKPFQEQNVDVIVACALLLLHYAWTIPFSSSDLPPDPDGTLDIGADNLLSFAAGLKSVIVDTRSLDSNSFCVFKPILRPDTVKHFTDWAASTTPSYDFEGKFFHRPKVTNTSNDDLKNENECVCWNLTDEPFGVVDRLIPILHIIDALSRGDDLAYLMTEVKSYLLMWPGKCSKEFEDALRKNSTDALIAMLCFYASTYWLVSKDVWWVQERSKFMYLAISERLFRKGNVDDRVINICEYFKITGY